MKTFSPESSPIENLFASLAGNIKNELERLAHEKGVSVPEFINKERADEYEDVLEAALRSAPEELLKKRLALYEEKDFSLEDALKDALSFTKKRETLWQYDGKEEYLEETVETIKVFDSAKYHQELFEGRGNAAHVFQVPEVPKVCIKFLHSPNMQRYSPEREFGILETVSEIAQNFKALKVPTPHGVAVHVEKHKSFFTMETIDGMTLLELIERPGLKNDFLARSGLSESFLISALSDPQLQEAMRKDLALLHKNGILHGDIHPRNIMINTAGDFYLIDFGNAIIETNLPPGVDSETIENTKEIDLKSFVNCFSGTAKSLQKQIMERIKEEV